jgi:hypothetical protein
MEWMHIVAINKALFKKIAGSQANNKSDNFRDGRGVAEIDELKYENLNDGATFIARVKILSSEPKDEFELAKFEPGKPHQYVEPRIKAATNPPGSKLGWVQKTDKFKSAPGNVKAFVLALLGFDEAEVSEDEFAETLEELVGKDQPAKGMLISFDTYRQMTRTGANAGSINTYVSWAHVKQTEEEIKARRAAAGGDAE